MEIENRIKTQNENHEHTYKLKEQKAINAAQADELKRQNEINQVLELEIKKLRKLSLDNNLKMIGTSTFGLLAGFSVKS